MVREIKPQWKRRYQTNKPESFNEGSMLNANFNSDGNANVNNNWNPENQNPNLGGRSEVESCLSILFLGIFSTLQASDRSLGGKIQAVDIFCYLVLGYLLQALLGFLGDLRKQYSFQL